MEFDYIFGWICGNLSSMRRATDIKKQNQETFKINFIFQFVNCLTGRHNTYLKEEDSKAGHQLASFLSGLSFYFYPNIAVFSHAATTIIEIFWIKNYNQMKFISNWIPLDKIKMIIFPIVFGYVLHIRAFTPWLAPSMLKKLMHLTTNYKYVFVFFNTFLKTIFQIFPFLFHRFTEMQEFTPDIISTYSVWNHNFFYKINLNIFGNKTRTILYGSIDRIQDNFQFLIV